MKTEEKSYDLEAVYDEQVSPLMAQIIKICKENNLPMFATFQYKADSETGDIDYATTNIPATGDRVRSKQLAKLLGVIQSSGEFAAFTITTKLAEGQ